MLKELLLGIALTTTPYIHKEQTPNPNETTLNAKIYQRSESNTTSTLPTTEMKHQIIVDQNDDNTVDIAIIATASLDQMKNGHRIIAEGLFRGELYDSLTSTIHPDSLKKGYHPKIELDLPPPHGNYLLSMQRMTDSIEASLDSMLVETKARHFQD